MDAIDRTNAIDAEIVGPDLGAGPALAPAPAAAPDLARTLEDTPLPMPPAAVAQAAAPPAYVAASPVLFVAFVGLNRKGKQKAGRTFISDFMVPATTEDVRRIEVTLEANTDLTEVQLTNWHQLRG